jgi:hypothetical protein
MPTANQLLVVDPLLTAFAVELAATQGASFKAREIMPAVPTQLGAMSGVCYEYPAANTMKRGSPAGAFRADKAGPNYIDWAIASTTFKTVGYGYADLVSDQDKRNAAVGPMDPETESIQVLTQKMLIERELRVYTKLAAIVAATTLSGAAQWSSTSADPFGQIQIGIDVLLKTTGRKPMLVIDGATMSAFKAKIGTSGTAAAKIADLIKYTNRITMENITPDLLAGAFGLPRVVVADAVYDSAPMGATAVNGFIWAEKAAYLVVQDERSNGPNSRFATFGRTLVSKEMVIRTWPEPSLNDSMAHELYEECDEKILSTSHIYKIAGVVA